MDKEVVANWIRSHEVADRQAHTAPDGHSTIGIGFDLDEVGARERLEGLGVNFESVLDGSEALTETQIEYLFNQDIDQSIIVAHAIFPDLDSYPENKQVAIIDMVYDLGERDFKKLDTVIDAIKQQHWADASTKMQESVLFNQLSHRATEEINLMRDGYMAPITDYSSTHNLPDSVPYHASQSIGLSDFTMMLMLMDKQHEHSEHHTAVDHIPTSPSPDPSLDHSETQPVGSIPVDNVSPYIDFSPQLTANDIYLVTDQPGDPWYPSVPNHTPTDLVPGVYVDYTETYSADGIPMDTTKQNIDPTANDIYLNNECINVQGGWRTSDDLQEFMARNGFETNPPFNGSPGLEEYVDQSFPDIHLEGGHDFVSVD
jgi:lysozyme